MSEEPIEVTPLEALRVLIAEKCGRGKPDRKEIALWLVDERANLLILALDQLITEAIEQAADDAGAQTVLEMRPSLRPIDNHMRVVAAALGVQRRFLLSRTSAEMREACRLAEAVFELQAAAAAAWIAAQAELPADAVIVRPATERLQ